MITVISLSEARNNLPKLVDLADTISRKTLISVSGKVKAAIVSARDLELMEETLEILSDPKAMESIKKGRKDFKKGKLIDWKELKEELGI